MGAWIEISLRPLIKSATTVAPYMGAWIEIGICIAIYITSFRSLPTWERGLKSYRLASASATLHVAPYMGAWIEIFSVSSIHDITQSLPTWERGLKSVTGEGAPDQYSRSLHGSVD